MGLGPVELVSLAEARNAATEGRKLLLNRIDPIEHRKEERARQHLEDAHAKTFAECAEGYIDAHSAGWKNKKHAAQWRSTLKSYAGPIIGDVPISAIDTTLVLKVLEPVWTGKPETASRLRGRIERILDWSRSRGYRDGENPARWRGNLEHTLPLISKVKRVKHFPALPFTEISSFMTRLRQQEGTAAKALELTILTAARTREVTEATWEEIDVETSVWTIPGERMKSGRPHTVPLSPSALSVLESIKAERKEGNPFVFPGGRADRPLSNMSMLKLLGRMERSDITVHGFRSTFRDWAAELTSFPREVVEMALAHVITDKTEAAYRRGDLLTKRRDLMDRWADYCDEGLGNVFELPVKGANA
jgi:integrase